MQKKQKYNLTFFNKLVLIKSLVAIFATGLFAVNNEGKFLSNNKDKSLLQKAVKNLSNDEYDKFILGRSFFTIPWVEAPSATSARDGLGPLFNANTCVSCHPKNGRGTLFNKNKKVARSLVARLSIASDDSTLHKEQTLKNGFVLEPTYGAQISINGVHGVKFEARPKVEFETIEVKFPDGEIDTILKPTYSLIDKNYGELDKSTSITYRIAPSLHGLGLIEKISNVDILKNVDEFDKNNDGISGRANYVYSKYTNVPQLGKYTWKASSYSVKHQAAAAASNDMGLTTTFFKDEPCTKAQKECNNAPKAKHKIDIPDKRLDAIAFYLKNTKAYQPKVTKDFIEGKEVFETIGCVNCHQNSFETSDKIKISPYSDFLLHDMGKGLSDGRSEFRASAQEWKTAPLWGLSLHEKINKKNPRLLHDGRARNFQEAILWHGGEASTVKENYMNLSKKLREKLLKFLKEL
jgi:CxxC motif-containing protein (DUF1111 family)